jgi:hypothetical protein
MNPDPVSAIFGGCLVLLGLLLQLPHRAAWLLQQTEFAHDPRELWHHESRYRRRRQTSGLIALTGLLIVVADLPVVWRQGPLFTTILWIAIGCLCLWIALLAFGDLLATRAHARSAMTRLENTKQQMVNQLQQFRPDAKPDKG